MKSISILCLIFLACMLQTNLTGSSQKPVSAKNGGTIETGMPALEGRQLAKADSVVTCRGDCQMTVNDVMLKADEMDFHQNTGEVEARGNVRVRFLTWSKPPAVAAGNPRFRSTVLPPPNQTFRRD